MVRKVAVRLGVDVPLAAVFDAPTVGALARYVDRRLGSGTPPATAATSIVTLRECAVGRPLFVVHPVGGHTLGYRHLVRHLRALNPVYGIERPELASGDAPRFVSVDDLAARYAEDVVAIDPGGPYRLCGWSLGGFVALKVAARLRAAGKRVDYVGLIDVMLPHATGASALADVGELAGAPGCPTRSARCRRRRGKRCTRCGPASRAPAPAACRTTALTRTASSSSTSPTCGRTRRWPRPRRRGPSTIIVRARPRCATTSSRRSRRCGKARACGNPRVLAGDHDSIVAEPIASELAALIESDMR